MLRVVVLAVLSLPMGWELGSINNPKRQVAKETPFSSPILQDEMHEGGPRILEEDPGAPPGPPLALPTAVFLGWGCWVPLRYSLFFCLCFFFFSLLCAILFFVFV